MSFVICFWSMNWSSEGCWTQCVFLQAFMISMFNLMLIKNKTKPINSVILGISELMGVLNVLSVQVWLSGVSRQLFWVTFVSSQARA